MKYNELKQKIKHLPVFTSSMLKASGETSTLKVQLSQWKKKGLISQLRRGLYTLCKEEREIEPTHFFLANQIFIPSYVSLESALAFYGLIPEFVASTTSITARKTCKFKNEFGIFTYQHIKKEGYDGFISIQEKDNINILIATPEKAVVDFVYLNLERFNLQDISVFTESYRFQNYERLSKKKIRRYAINLQSRKLILVLELFIKQVLK